MLSAALTRALTTPAFIAADFVPTHWDSAEQKAKFANALLTFVAQDFPRSKFHEGFYRRLSNAFGHIANFNSAGFYEPVPYRASYRLPQRALAAFSA